MTREEAIKLIEHISITFVPTDQYGDYDDPQPYEEALDMAIEALQNLSKPNNGLQGSDLIRRSDAIDVWWHDEVFFGNQRDDMTKEQWLDYITDVIGSLPSAESKTGHWVEIEDYNGDIHYQCDKCGEEFILIDGTPEDNNYWHCPNCGSYNREVRKNDKR